MPMPKDKEMKEKYARKILLTGLGSISGGLAAYCHQSDVVFSSFCVVMSIFLIAIRDD
tara:strand:+ start:1975 stop:2148 length:174 start_codon:yes stop_codon:yes gene_type:complete